MSDLINREELHEAFLHCYRVVQNDCDLEWNRAIDRLDSLLMEEPTAFDNEKVMSEMRKEYEDATRLYGRDRKTAHNYSSWVRKDAWEKAIEIVEKGGVA